MGSASLWEKTHYFSGQKLKVMLQMTDSAYQRWKDQTAFLQTLKNGQILTETEAEKIKGHWPVLAQFKTGHKVDTKEGMKVYKSVYGF